LTYKRLDVLFGKIRSNSYKCLHDKHSTNVKQPQKHRHHRRPTLTCDWEINIVLCFRVVILCALNDDEMGGKVDAPSKCTGCNQHLKHARKRLLPPCANQEQTQNACCYRLSERQYLQVLHSLHIIILLWSITLQCKSKQQHMTINQSPLTVNCSISVTNTTVNITSIQGVQTPPKPMQCHAVVSYHTLYKMP